MTDLESYIKEVIRKILICSGEPFTTSDIVVDIIYEYICRTVLYIRMHLSVNLPNLQDVLILCREQPIRLIRIVKYFRTISNSSFIKINNVEDIDEQLSSLVKYNEDITDGRGAHKGGDQNTNDNNTEKETNGSSGCNGNPNASDTILQNSKLVNSLLSNEDSNLLRLNTLLNQLSIPSPSNNKPELFWEKFNPKLLQIYEKINQGRLLRLLRIDSKLCCETVEEFLAFNRLRQSASFLCITRSRNFEKFWYWLFYYPLKKDDNSVVMKNDKSSMKKTNGTVSSSASSSSLLPGMVTTTTRTPPTSKVLLTSKEMREFYLKMRTRSTHPASTSSTSSSTSSSSSAPTVATVTTNTCDASAAGLHEGLIVIAYLLTGDILDIIDLVLFNRKKFNINLSSPITPIEVKEVLKVFQSVLYPL